MATDLSKIRDALSALSPELDADWTGQGLPAMEAVCAKLGATVTRREVEAAAPGFCRTNLAMPSDDDVGPSVTISTPPSPDSVEQQIAETMAAAVQQAMQDDPAKVVDHLSDRAERRLAAEKVRDEAIAGLQQARAEALEKMAAAKREADAIDRQINEARNEFDLEYPPLTEAETYQLVVRRSQEERARRVADEQAARKILGQGGKSKLDQALSARRGFGLQRPSYPTTGGR